MSDFDRSKRRSLLHDRRRIADAAARLIAEEGIENFAVAKRKAAARLGMKPGKNLPDNVEIDTLLAEYQRLFRSESQESQVHDMRTTALAAMRSLTRFQPRLVGAVLNGTASEHSAINLHVFADAVEDVGFELADRTIPFTLSEKKVKYSLKDTPAYPCYRFFAGRHAIEITVFKPKDLRQAPLSPIDGKPMRRADIGDLESLLAVGA